MEKAFLAAWASARAEAEALGVRMRPVPPEGALRTAHRALTGSRPSDGFHALTALGRLELTLEALAVDRRYTALFSDEEVNEALSRLLDAGYRFQ